MSLVVAEQTAEGPRIVSDTKVVFPDGQRTSFRTDALKAVTVSAHVSICFAGDVVAGLTAIRDFAKGLEAGAAIGELSHRLVTVTASERRTVEFIVATGGNESALIRIGRGLIEEKLQAAWIGDKTAFERFQQARQAPLSAFEQSLDDKLSASVRTMMRLIRAMEAVISDSAIQSVGDFCAANTWKPTGFEYPGVDFRPCGPGRGH